MNSPEGEVRDRAVVSDLGETLADILATELTGYIRIESDTSLLAADDATHLTVERGVPVAATTTNGDARGAPALAEAAVADLYRIERHALTVDQFESLPGRGDDPLPVDGDESDAVIPPGLPAEQLAGNNDLAERTRAAAPATHPGLAEDSNELDAVTSFLDDTEAIASIRDRARDEARERADEWGFAVQGDGSAGSPDTPDHMDEE